MGKKIIDNYKLFLILEENLRSLRFVMVEFYWVMFFIKSRWGRVGTYVLIWWCLRNRSRDKW